MRSRALKKKVKELRRVLIRQQDESDCGVACLGTVIQFYGGQVSLERLRELSGTSQQGTTLLGLYQAAEEVGLDAGSYKADIEALQHVKSLCIFHVIQDGNRQHYVVCIRGEDGEFIVADPASGVTVQSRESLESVWKTRSLLILEPTPQFIARKAIRRDKWQWITALVHDDLNILGLALALGLAISLLSLSTAIFSQKLIDVILPEKQTDLLILGLVLLSILLIGKNGLSYIRQRFLVEQRRDFNKRVIQHFIKSLVRLPQSFFFTRKIGDLIARMNDTSRLQGTVAYIIGDMMIEAITLLTASIFIFAYSIPLGFLAVGSLPLFIILAYKYHQPILDGQRNVMAAHSVNESQYVDTIRGMSTIKTQSKEDFFSVLTSNIYGMYQETIYRLGRIGIGFNFWAEFLGTLLLLAILSWSSLLVLDGILQLGVLVAILQMGNLLIPAALNLSMTNIRLQEARVAFERMYEFTSLEPEYFQKDSDILIPSESLQSLTVKNLDFRFKGQPLLLKNICFNLHNNEIVALLGESGSGKTTLLQILLRFYQQESGEILVNDTIPLWDTAIPVWRQFIGIVPQEVTIFNGSVLHNIALIDAPEHVESVIGFCKTAGFDPLFAKFPHGYATLLGEEGTNISGGQRQVVAFARALYQHPQLLLLDEATAEMDTCTEEAVLAILDNYKEDMSILMVTHQARLSLCADRVYIIENGTISSQGIPGELLLEDNLLTRSLERVFSLDKKVRVATSG